MVVFQWKRLLFFAGGSVILRWLISPSTQLFFFFFFGFHKPRRWRSVIIWSKKKQNLKSWESSFPHDSSNIIYDFMIKIIVFVQREGICEFWHSKKRSSHVFLNITPYCTSRSSDLDILKPSSCLITRLQRDLLPRLLTSSREEAEAGKQKVTFFCTKRNRHRG